MDTTNTGEFEDYEGEDHKNSKQSLSNAEFDRIRTRGRERFKYLAKHKEPKVEWWTCVGPAVNWGTQDPIWPINKATISASPSPRVAELASPKKYFLSGSHANRPLWYYSCGRASALTTVDENALNANLTSRLEQLALSKTYPQYTSNRLKYAYSCGRSSPIWSVSSSALNSSATPRISDLSKHKPYHPRFQPERPLPWEVPEPAKRARTSPRIEQLSVPKTRTESPYRDPIWPVRYVLEMNPLHTFSHTVCITQDCGMAHSAAKHMQRVPESALNSVPTPRCIELARSKALAEGFQPAREIEWPVSKAAKQASASERLSALAQPIQRMNMNILQFNPDAFKVKPEALKGQIPPRINELAQPVNR